MGDNYITSFYFYVGFMFYIELFVTFFPFNYVYVDVDGGHSPLLGFG